jgi:isopentenyl phosphate kinase
MESSTVFVKLGGSLITQKNKTHTPRLDVIARLADEIAQARSQQPGIQILLGHGSGSFGHHAAAKYGTRGGVKTPQDWAGFAEVWHEARSLNQIVMEALVKAGLAAVAFPPSAWLVTADGKVEQPENRSLMLALEHDLLPVVQGDVAFDTVRGGTIVSTEDVFAGLVSRLKPDRILLAGVEEGVWGDYPACTWIAPEITCADINQVDRSLRGSANLDVTGGMREKVMLMLSIVETFPTLRVQIFSGVQPGNLFRALLGEPLGTLIHA